MTISEKLKLDLINNMDVERVFQKHVVDGASFIFSQPPFSADDEYRLRHEIASCLGVSINDVVLVGSAKLGFSVATTDFFDFDHRYSNSRDIRDKSDIDIAIINRELFDKIAEQIYHLSGHFKNQWIKSKWTTNQYYVQGVNLYHEYTKYFTKGWLRPDYMPNEYLSIAPWISECHQWSKKTGRKVSVGIYSNWTYLKHYHMDHLENLKAALKTLEKK